MATIPARCPIHGMVRVESVIVGAATIQMIGGTASCPICGASSTIPDGAYTFDDAARPGVTWFKPITPAQAQKIKTAVTWAKSQLEAGADDELVKQKIDAVLVKHAPGWKKVIDTLLSTRAVNLYQLLGFILMLLVFFGLDPVNQAEQSPAVPQLTDDQVCEMFDEYLDQRGTESDKPTLPTPAPVEPTPEVQPTQEA